MLYFSFLVLYNSYRNEVIEMGKYTVTEIADMFNVSTTAVRLWIKKGLKTETEKVIGLKPRMVVDKNDVCEFLGVDIKSINNFYNKNKEVK